MILVICTDDRSLEAIAAQATAAAEDTYGLWYRVFNVEVPKLGIDESLFILAHGAKDGDDGNPVIGSEENALYLNGPQLSLNLKPIMPDGYSGDVFISACESIDRPSADALSFAEMFKCSMIEDYEYTGKVFGQTGIVAGPLPLPTSVAWREATPICSPPSSSPKCDPA